MFLSLKKLMNYTLFFICIIHLNAQYTTSDFGPTSLITDGLNAPGRMAIDTNDDIYAIDAIQKNIVKYDAQGNYLGMIDIELSPLSVAINHKDQLYVGDQTTGDIYTINSNGSKTKFYSGLSFPASMVFGLNNILYVVDSQQKKVIGLDVSGNVVKDFTYSTFTFPTGIAFDKHNNHIIVSEHGGVGNDVQTCGGGSMSWGTTGPLTTIYIFDIEGNLVNNFGCFGTKDGLFQRIQGVTVGTCGNIYAVDPYLGRVSVFDDNGNYITKFGQQGDGPGEFNLPMDIVFSSDNRAFISSMNKGEIDVFSITQTLPSSTITSPDEIICAAETKDISVALTGAAPWTFTYTIDGLSPTEITTNETPYQILASEEGLYEITALIDGDNNIGTCFTGSTYVEVSNVPPTATIVSEDFSKCSGDTNDIAIQFTGIAPWTFTFTVNGLNPTEITTIEGEYNLEVQESGLYEITSLTDAGCSGSITLINATVTVHPLPTASITNGNDRILIKPGESTDLNIAFTGTAPWTFVYVRDEQNPISITTSSNLYVLSVSEAGTYEVIEIQDAYCMSDISDGYPELVIDDTPEPAIATIESFTNFICQGSTTTIPIQLSGTAPWTFSYTLDGLNPIEITTANNTHLLSVSTPGLYELSDVSDANNTSGIVSGSAIITEYPNPIVDLPENLMLCEGSSVQLDPGNFESYLWSDGSTNSTFEVNTSGNYTVTVSDSNGCSTTASVDVLVNSLPIIDLGPDIDICEGDPAHILDAGIFDTYLWSDGSTNRTLEVSASGVHTVTVTDYLGCSNTASVSVEVHLLPSANFFYDGNKLEVQFISDATNTDTHYWEFGDGTSSIDENPLHFYSKKGTYTVTYFTSNEYCGIAQKSVDVIVGNSEGSNIVAIYPNPSTGAFTLKITPTVPITTDISIFINSLSGQLIYSEVFNPNFATSYDGSIYKYINLVNFTKGIYFINVNAGNFAEQEKLILKD